MILLAPVPLSAMSRTYAFRTPLDARALRSRGLTPLPLQEGLFKTRASRAALAFPVIRPPSPFTSLVGSWNARDAGRGTTAMDARVLSSGAWSVWFKLGESRGRSFYSPPRQDSSFGFVDVDTLKLKKPAEAFELRMRFEPGAGPIVLSLAAATVWDGKTAASRKFEPGPWVREIAVAPRSQMEEQKKYRRNICSPTALSMALSYWGRVLDTKTVVLGARDKSSGLYGNWSANVFFAGRRGLLAYVARLDSLRALERQIALGHPVVASLTFEAGELAGAPVRRTSGHVLLVVGFTAQGDVIALDPAAPRKASARRVYDRAQFRAAWLKNKGGLSYLIHPLEGSLLRVAVPRADLWSRPGAAGKPEHDLKNPNHLSQILYGEPVSFKKASGAWAQVSAVEQPRFDPKAGWGGYGGWVQTDTLAFAPLATDASAVVCAKKAGSGGLVFSVGTRLPVLSREKGSSTVELLDGGSLVLPSQALEPLAAGSESRARRRILEAASLFLGTSYYWGGRSGVQDRPEIGVDCSGLVSLSYRSAGLDVPRNAQDQKRRARPLKRRDLKPGDLVFLSRSADSPRITHVMIYAGQDAILESRQAGDAALKTTFKERFRQPLDKMESGRTVTDYSTHKPSRRRIYFGGFLPGR